MCVYLTLDEVTYSRFCHDGDCDGFHDFFDESGVGHACDAALGPYVCGDALEGHDGYCAGFFCNAGLVGSWVVSEWDIRGAEVLGGWYLLGVNNVHDDAAFEHACQTCFDSKAGCATCVPIGVTMAIGTVAYGEFGGHDV